MASKKHRHSDILAAFAEQVQHCEAGYKFEQKICGGAGWQYLDIHHVMGGPHRIDAPWNLVRLCGAAHHWVTANPIEGRVLCWWILRQRGALDCAAIHEATGIHPVGWIAWKQAEIRLPWVADLARVFWRSVSDEGEH